LDQSVRYLKLFALIVTMSPVILNRSEHRKDRKIFNDVLPKLAAQVVHKARLHAHVAYSQLRNRHAGDIKTCRHRSGDDRNASVYGQVPFPFWALQGENAHVLPNGERHQAPHIEINKLIGSLFREVVVWPIPLLHHLMRLPGQQKSPCFWRQVRPTIPDFVVLSPARRAICSIQTDYLYPTGYDSLSRDAISYLTSRLAFRLACHMHTAARNAFAFWRKDAPQNY